MSIFFSLYFLVIQNEFCILAILLDITWFNRSHLSVCQCEVRLHIWHLYIKFSIGKRRIKCKFHTCSTQCTCIRLRAVWHEDKSHLKTIRCSIKVQVLILKLHLLHQLSRCCKATQQVADWQLQLPVMNSVNPANK